MSSRSASPSITQFFKTKRKRPRTGKEDGGGGVTTTSKKILLEEGIVKLVSGGAVLKEDVEGPSLPFPPVAVAAAAAPAPRSKPVAVVRKRVKPVNDKPAVDKPRDDKTDKEGEKDSSKRVDSPIKLKEEEPVTSLGVEVETPVESKGEEEQDHPSKNVTSPVKSTVVEEQVPSKSVDTPVESKGVEEQDSSKKLQSPVKSSRSEPIRNKRIESPVRYLKVGPLSPAKKKKLTTEQVARLLKKKTKLGELKSTLEGINQCAQKLSDFRRTVAEKNAKLSPARPPLLDGAASSSPSLRSPSKRPGSSFKEGISPAQFYSPTADRVRADLERLSATKYQSPSKLISINNKVKKRLFEQEASPNREEGKTAAVPAYQRLHSLAQKTPAEKGTTEGLDTLDLPLPYHFKVLKELFIGVETVAGIMKSRKERMLFPKLKSGVLELVRKISLREKHLAQMVAVLPGCYSFGLEKVGTATHIRIEVEDLTPTVVCARRKAFHIALVKICLQHHQKFLLGLAPPIVVPADKQITRWHPQFKIDEIPDIIPEEDALPAKPTPDKISTAREVIAKAQNILENANPRMKTAVKNMLNNADGDGVKTATPVIAQPSSKATEKVKALKGVSTSLLEKIRNREREKLLNEMTRSPAESKKLQMTKRMPHFIKIIRNMMVADKKVALPMDVVVGRVSHSMQSLSPVDTEEHVRLMATLLPKWIRILKLSNSDTEYVRIEKTTDINDLLEEMNDIIKNLSK